MLTNELENPEAVKPKRSLLDLIKVPLRSGIGFLFAAPPSDERGRLKGPWLVLVMALCFAFSVGVRLHQIEKWKGEPEEHFVNGVPLMVTHDAYYWLRWAKYEKYHRWGDDDGLSLPPPPEFDAEHSSLLSFLVAAASHYSGKDVYTAALYLIPWLASLFILPLIAYFNRFGEAYAGALGALIATSALEYMSRTCVGCVDTDALNLFFPVLAGFFILRAGTGKSHPLRVVDAALAGLTVRVFHAWYSHHIFTIVFFVTLILFLAVRRVPLRWFAACLGIFLVCGSTSWMRIGFNEVAGVLLRYTETDRVLTSTDSIHFLPNILGSIAETRRMGLAKTLNLIVKDPFVSGGGIALFLLFSVRQWKNLLPIAPVAAIGALSFFAGRRFALYLVPFVGIGYGFLIAATVRFLAAKFPGRPWTRFLRPAGWAAAAIFFIAILPLTAVHLKIGSPFSTQYYRAMLDLKRTLPKNSWIWNYWDYGLLLKDVTGFEVYSDGREPWKGVNYFMAKSYVSPAPSEMRRIIAYAHNNLDDLVGMQDLPSRSEDLARDRSTLADPVYVLFDYHMLPFFSSIYSLGAWDFKTGIEPYPGYRIPKCHRRDDGLLQCDQLTISLTEGTINGKKGLLQRSILIKGGKAIKESVYGKMGWSLQIVKNERDETIFTLLLSDPLYRSNFNQMFLLGKYDQTLFEEIDNRFPYARTFRVRPEPL